MRFFPNAQGGYYCDSNYPTANRVFSLPVDSYQDVLSADRGEFAWGIQAWHITLNTQYSIHFECQYTTQARDSGQFNLTGQIGHCHSANPCSDASTYSDETTRLIPKRQGRAPTTIDWLTPWANDFSLELPPGSNAFSWQGGTPVRICGGSWYESCYWQLRPAGSTSNPAIFFDVVPDTFIDPLIGTASVYHEFQVRCPTSQPNNCQARLILYGLNATGGVTQTFHQAWQSVPKDGTWRRLWYRNSGFPTGTTRWRFYLQAYAGDTIDADYTTNFWNLPA
jgi:hypothetical protein